MENLSLNYLHHTQSGLRLEIYRSLFGAIGAKTANKNLSGLKNCSSNNNLLQAAQEDKKVIRTLCQLCANSV